MTLTIVFIGLAFLGVLGMFVALPLSADDLFFGSFWLSIAGLLLCLVSLVWNALDDPEHGWVTGKDFTPRHLVCTKGCFYVDDTWELELDDNGNTGWITVKESTYNNFDTGDYFGGRG